MNCFAFDETSFTQLGSYSVNDVGSGRLFDHLREELCAGGKNGLAVSAAPGPLSSVGQIFHSSRPLW